jgi:transposase
MEIVYERVAGIDVHKRQITVTVRTPGVRSDKRREQVRRYATFYSALREMTSWLIGEAVTHVAMESTGVYWKPVFHALAEPGGLEIVLCNAAHVKNVPGRKTDVKDSQWLAQLCEVGLLRGSFIPPADIAAIRELCRYRRTLVEERTREGQRLRKVLEDGGIKLDSVASDVLGVSARSMIKALIDGERNPTVLADLAQRTLRRKIPDLTLALAGRFDEHHAVLCGLHLEHIDHINAMIGKLDTRIGQVTDPFANQRQRLTSIPGIGELAARAIIGEIGVDMSRFPTAAHLASWAGLCPGNHESAGKRRSGRIRHGNAHLCTILVEAAWATDHTTSRLGSRLRRLKRRMGKKSGPKAAVAVAHTILTIVWHLLAHGGTYQELGADYYTHREENPETLAARLKKKIESLGYTVELKPAA